MADDINDADFDLIAKPDEVVIGPKELDKTGNTTSTGHSSANHCHLIPYATGEWKLESWLVDNHTGKTIRVHPDQWFKSGEDAHKAFDECTEEWHQGPIDTFREVFLGRVD